MSNTRSLSPSPLLAAELTAERRRVVAWALSVGRPVDASALGMIQRSKASLQSRTGIPYATWTEATLLDVLWVELSTWARGSHPSQRTRAAETLWTYLQYLAIDQRLDAASSDVDTLLSVLGRSGGLTADGRCRVRADRERAVVIPFQRRRTPRARTPPAGPSHPRAIRHS